MANKITIAELDINTDALLKSATDTKRAMDALKDENKELKKSTEDTTEAQVKNEAALKNLTTQYNQQKKVLSAVTDENNDLIKAQKSLNDALNKTIKTETQATANNVKLLALRKDINTTTDKGRKQIELINDKIDKNNELLKENASKSGKAKLSIGGYKDAIKDAFGELGLLGGALDKAASFQEKFSGLVSVGGKTFKTASVGTNIATKALRIFTLTLAATGIGLVVIAIAALVSFFSKFTVAIDGVKTALAPIVSLFEVLVGWFGNLVASGGEVSKSWTDLKGDARELANAKIELIKLTREQERLNVRLSRENAILSRSYEKLTNASDDATTSLAEQRKASEEAAIIGEQLAKNNVESSRLEINRSFAAVQATQEGTEDRIEAEKEYSSAITSFTDAQISLDNTLFSNRKRLREIDQDDAEQQLDFLIDGAQLARETLKRQAEDESLPIEERKKANSSLVELSRKNASDQVAILQGFTDNTIDLNSLINESDASVLAQRAKSLGLSEILTTRLLEVIRETQSEQLEFADNIKKTADAADKATEESTEKQKKARESELAQIQDFEDRKRELNNQIELENELDDEERAVLKAEQDFENQQKELEDLQINQDQKDQLQELLLITQEAKLQAIRDEFTEKEIIAEVDADKKKSEIAKNDLRREKILQQQKLTILSNTFGNIAELLGKNTAAGKAAAIAQAGINTFQGITEVWKSPSVLPEPFATSAKVISTGTVLASGLQAVGKIRNTPTPNFYEGGQVPTGTGGSITNTGNIPTQRGGDNVLATVKTGEVILNEQQQRNAGGSAFFRSIGVPGFQTGGLVGTQQSAQAAQLSQINIDALADVLSERINAIKVVAIVDEITGEQAIQAEIVDGANI